MKKTLLTLASLLSANAFAQESVYKMTTQSSEQKQALQGLIEKGVLSHVEGTLRFDVRLQEPLEPTSTTNGTEFGAADFQQTMDALRLLLGEGIDVRKVKMVDASFATQDV